MNAAFASLSEDKLVRGLQPVRFFALAQVLYCFLECGAYQAMVEEVGRLKVSTLAQELSLDPRRLRGVFQFLHNEGYVELKDDDVSLTEIGRALREVRPWYTLLVGGYAQAFQDLPAVLKSGGPYASRNGSAVGIGSCGISQHDALPMTRVLLESAGLPLRFIVDLGCGDGSYLIDLCQSLPNVRGLGLDPSCDSVANARARITQLGLEDRLEVNLGNATDAPEDLPASGLCFITAFVLQEILEQSGRDAVVELLASNFRTYPSAHWVVIEVDERAADETVMSTDLGRAYYNPYYLLHHLTEQRLETIPYWQALFSEAGAEVVDTVFPDPAYDSLRLKVGFLLRSREAP